MFPIDPYYFLISLSTKSSKAPSRSDRDGWRHQRRPREQSKTNSCADDDLASKLPPSLSLSPILWQNTLSIMLAYHMYCDGILSPISLSLLFSVEYSIYYAGLSYVFCWIICCCLCVTCCIVVDYQFSRQYFLFSLSVKIDEKVVQNPKTVVDGIIFQKKDTSCLKIIIIIMQMLVAQPVSVGLEACPKRLKSNSCYNGLNIGLNG